MQALHIVTPSDSLTTPEILGLLRLTQQQIGGSHKTLVIGGNSEATYLRTCGISILGSVDGPDDASKTLASRIMRLIELYKSQGISHIVGWGWHSSAVVCRLETTLQKITFVDGIEPKVSLTSNDVVIIPTSWDGSNCLRQINIGENYITEPLVGVEPTTMVTSRTVVRDALQLDDSVHVIAIVGSRSSYHEILEMLFRIKTTGEKVTFVLPYNYKYRGVLMRVAQQRGLSNFLVDLPPTIRSTDMYVYADGVWVPSNEGFEASCCVLDVLKVAWEDVPLAVLSSHPIHSVPIIGTKIAWARDQLDVSSWILDIVRGSHQRAHECAALTTNVRSIAAPSRFIEGLQHRVSFAPSLRFC